MLCPNINHNLSWRVNGTVSPCNNLINFPLFQTVDALYNSNEFKKLASDSDKGIKSEYCTRCWDKETLGLTSKRQYDLNLDKIYKKVNSSYIKIDGALGSVCNAACVICGPDSSSLWQKYIPINRVDNKLEIWSVCDNNVKNILQLDFGGGEPWLNQIDKQIELFNKLIEINQNQFVKIRYNTNGSLYPEKLLEKLVKFRQVEITLSIDDIEERFEYNRWPLKWEAILFNIKKLQLLAESHNNIILTVNFTVSVFTWLRAEFFLKWANQFGLDKVNFNILTTPEVFSIKYLNIKNNLPNTIFNELIGNNSIDNWTQMFLSKLEDLDRERKTNWKNIFPELVSVLQI